MDTAAVLCSRKPRKVDPEKGVYPGGLLTWHKDITQKKSKIPSMNFINVLKFIEEINAVSPKICSSSSQSTIADNLTRERPDTSFLQKN
ncbi:MAG: hypothetical protein CSA09_03975 [Candidatus Contendobacter odensis]|uniref:Uncharacterized protein n=1 Tax=Candidatus Contendibacter odensensis TaxID=1400860 RepID=A0A2G6PEH4_9GAMM|nr:MAG: hypothetical protein CSA09_03975 [Candidatus Contendobacter odensis]